MYRYGGFCKLGVVCLLQLIILAFTDHVRQLIWGLLSNVSRRDRHIMWLKMHSKWFERSGLQMLLKVCGAFTLSSLCPATLCTA